MLAWMIPQYHGASPQKDVGMLNYCMFIYVTAAIAAIVGMIIRPTKFYTVYKKR